MYRSLAARLTIIVAVSLICVLFVCQFFGFPNADASQASASPHNSVRNQLATTPKPGGLEWAVVAVLVPGALIFLLRPRRRVTP